MLEQVSFIRMNGDELGLPLTNVTQGIAVQSIEGLDPVKATLSASSFAQQDGAFFHGSRREVRDIKFTLGLEPSWGAGSVRDIRNLLYDFLMPETNIRMRFHMEHGTSYNIWGRVETFESPMFAQEPVVQINTRCFNPDFFSTGWNTLALNSTSGSFPNILDYDGTVESGIIVSGTIPRALSSITLSITTPDSGIRAMVLNYPFAIGDWVTINTTPGEREVLVKRSSTTTSLLYGMTPTSKWPMLERGRNEIRVQAAGAGFSLNMGWNDKYGGL